MGDKMTLVEFYDSNSIDNILSSLVLKPKRVLLLGECYEELEVFEKRMLKIFEKRKLNIKTECFETDAQNFDDIKKFLFEIVEKYERCAFDLTGGGDMVHLALGAVSEKLPLSMHFTDSRTGKIKVCSDGCGLYKNFFEPTLEFDEIAAVFGGVVKQKKNFSSYKTDNFVEDVKSLWSICAKNCVEWNKTVQTVANLIKNYAVHRGNNAYSADKNKVIKGYENMGRKFLINPTILLKLNENKLFLFSEKEGNYLFSFKNKLVKEALTKCGRIFELYTYMMSETLRYGGENFFDEVHTSVVLSWKGAGEKTDTELALNEVDVVIRKGIVPVFVSCKNGGCDSDELYKLAVVAKRFGGGAAKKVLFTTYFVPDSSFLQRAKELGITVIHSAHTMSYRKFSDKLLGLFLKNEQMSEK